MVIRLSKIFLIGLVIMSFSCKEKTQVENKNIGIIEYKAENINFFNKKYESFFTMIVDESTLADHPIKTYINCDSIGYFTIHYIPKFDNLQLFWKNDYFKNKNIENLEEKEESENIDLIIKKNIDAYNIFSYYVPFKYLNSNSGCSNESLFLENNSIAEIYYYNQLKQEWELLKQEKSNILPKTFDSNYFIKHFSNYFNKNINKILEENQSTPSEIVDNLIFTKDNNGNLQINTEILDYISKTTTKENSSYLFALEKYQEKYYSNRGDWNSDDYVKIQAYIFNTSYPLRKKYWSDKYDEWYNGKPEQLLGSSSNWMDNDYYGLPHLKEYVEDFIVKYL